MPELIGPVILDLAGKELSQEECELLQHPEVGGVILFTRNYSTPKELTQLCQSMRNIRKKPLLIVVDQEGGRVQRFRDGFTQIPPMGLIGKMHEISRPKAIKFAQVCGWIMAAEVLAMDIDMSFAPVLDLNKTNNPAIGDRAFHHKPAYVTELATSLMRGMHDAGMAATGKHFPGHGSVLTDSHVTLPMDEREFDDIVREDLQPFRELIRAGLNAMMPAHIIFSKVDANPVGFSKYWLRSVLREQYHFSGMIFSDDLNMNGASFAGNYPERACLALEAGCDMILICNNRTEAIAILDNLPQKYFLEEIKLTTLRKKTTVTLDELKKSREWREKQDVFLRMMDGFQEFVF